MDDRAVGAALHEAGLDALPLSQCSMKRRLRPGLLLGFSGIREPDIRDGVIRLRSVLERLAANGGRDRRLRI
jgi:hypothetical protein